jgi:pyridoxamine 5'-phosphate oxidase
VFNPLEEIIAERRRARELDDPLTDVCFLPTPAGPGQADVRPLSLRDIDERGLGILINRTSPKWEQLQQTARGMLLLYWPTVRRQYRVRGRFAAMEPAAVARYWAQKSHGSRLLECYYTAFHPQSQPVGSRDDFLQGIRALAEKYPTAESVPLPDTLVGLQLWPNEIETWHGSPADRLHDRRRYRRAGSEWHEEVLVP